MTLFQELKARGLIAQMSHEKEIEELLNSESVKFYGGFDATADSLHVGHLMFLITMRRFQQAGHRPVALLGTATTLIGDPTGKTDMRKMLTPEQIDYNATCFREQMSRFIDFGEGGAEIVRNGDWFADIKYLDFLGEIGRHFSVNKMLSAECFRSRYEGKGLTFLEFNYMLLQSYDFLHLYRTKDVKLQLGGDDQWSNVLAGADLIRRVDGEKAYAMTFALLATKAGIKMGKTEKGALWLSADKCSPYDFYQYFRNVDDSDVIDKLKMLTFVPLEEIDEREKLVKAGDGAKINEAKELLAYEMTALVHGREEAEKAQNAAKSVFSGSGGSEDIPTTLLYDKDFDLENGKISAVSLLVKTGLCSSNRDARTTIEQGGFSVDGEKITDVNALIEITEHVIIKKGKKNFHKAARQLKQKG
ncbi:MAG: tyrosine--tRNA ligase [Oscillospiraceae bacterium]|nr:tyrosine--tRNA ligase [Oscillospiraceae bacterium]